MGKRAENKPKAVKKKTVPKIKVNNRGGAYFSGASYSLDMQARFHVVLAQLQEEALANGTAVTSRSLAAKAQISPTTACKVIIDDAAGRISQRKD
jgi:hypothetical protein